MTPEVVELLRALSADIVQFPRVALLSPGKAERRLFPRAKVLRREDWDLDRPRRDLRFDLIIACHVFHYARDPARWFANVGASCRALLMADLIRRKRSPEGELGPDGDAVRYALDEHRPTLVQHFDLRTLGERLCAHHVYPGAANEHGPALHVMIVVRGELDGPLVHLSGYPCDARRLAPVHALLDAFDKRGTGICLGLAPALLPPGAAEHLAGLAHIEPALHSHASHEQLRPSLFDDLAWMGSARVRATLQQAKTRLETALGRAITTYVAPHGRLSRTAARELAGLGFGLCLSDRQTRPKLVASLRSDAVGQRQALARMHSADVIGLDLAVEHIGVAPLFEAIDAQRSAAAARVQRLAERVSALGTS